VAEQIRAVRVRHSSGATIDLTTAEYLTQWLADGKGEWRANTYRLRSGTTSRHIVPYIGSRLVADLDVDDVKLLLRKLKEREVGAPTRKQAHATLTAALNVLYRERKLLFNPCSLVRAPRYEPEEKIVLDRDQAMRLIAKAEGQVLVLIVMAATLAMREGELFGLLWNCVDLKAGTVTIVRQLAEDLDGNLVLSPLKTKASRRTLELPKLARRALQLLRGARRGEPGNAFAFTDGEGKPLRKSNFIRRDFKPLLVKAKLPDVAFHSLRHSSNSFPYRRRRRPPTRGETQRSFEYSHGARSVRPPLRGCPPAGRADDGPRVCESDHWSSNGRQTTGRRRAKENADFKKPFEISVRRGGGEETRTPDPLHAKQVLYQLSYTPHEVDGRF